MSTWHILTGASFEAPDGGLVSDWPCPPDLDVRALDTSDAESDPGEDDLVTQIVSLLPQGAAWGSPDGEAHDQSSEMATFWRGLAKVLKPLYAHGFTTALESTVSTISNSLEDWEQEFGLPDPCFGSDQSFETRLRAVVWKDLSPATITPGDYLCLASRLGYDIRIEEPEVFEAGLSECGLDHETATTNLEVEWVIHLVTGPTEYFHAGTSEASDTRLLDYPENTELDCVFRPLRPAWSLLHFNYTE